MSYHSGKRGVTTDDMGTMKRLAFSMALLWSAGPLMAGGLGEDPEKPQDPIPGKTQETRKPEQEVPLLRRR